MKFCVTGATGLVGNNLCRLLVQSGFEVIAPVRDPLPQGPFEGLPVQLVSGNLESRDFVNQCLSQADGLFHAAGLIWMGKSRAEESMRVNAGISFALGEACAERGIRMLHISTTDALAAGSEDRPATEDDLEPAKGDSNYVVSKRTAERKLLALTRDRNLDLVIANPGLMFGPYDWKCSSGKMILAITDGFVPLAPPGGISVADVRQVCKGLLRAWQVGRRGERYILGGENLTYLNLWRRIAALVGKRGPLRAMRRIPLKVVGRAGDVAGRFFGESNVNSAAVNLSMCFNYYDSSRARRELEYDPGTVDSALQDQWAWMLQQKMTRHARGPR
jgi:dihydroflavonol-4-reductase